MTLALHFAARSDVGLLREGNEDSGYAGPRLLVVADGMGGHAAGEVASSVAVATMSALDEDFPGPQLTDRLSSSVETANRHLRDMVSGDPGLRGMGTTLTALLRSGSRFGLVHVGDSRCYLLRGERFLQVTRDHTFVQTLVDEGRITAEQADHHPQRSLLTNALDGRDGVELDLSVRELRVGDRWMLCSDGLSGVVSEQTMKETLAKGDVDSAADALVDLALRGGGPDNVTVIVADVVDVDASPPEVPQVVGAAAATPGRQRRDGGSQSVTSSAAGRAAAALRPPPVPSTAAGPEQASTTPKSKRRLRLVLLLAGVAVLAALIGSAWTWAGGQFYVAPHGDRVAIYRGLSQNVLGWSPSRLEEDTTITLDSLSPYARRQVVGHIPAKSLADARDIVSRLESAAVPIPSGTSTAGPSAVGSTGTATAPPAAPGATTGGAASPGAGATPTGGR